MFKKYKILITLLPALFFFVLSCTTNGKPSKRGELLTLEQIQNLRDNKSLNGKLVEVEGYANLCHTFFVRLGEKKLVQIATEPNCGGEFLIDANIYFKKFKITLTGEKDRNEAVLVDNELLFTTDDYQEVSNQKLKFCGTLTYGKDNSVRLENVTIHVK
ncbi:hypothetical protein [Flavobacterium foetidum]|uniref:hypothetical protein n=1 Tax=Flavobacterium foetidum TaxID=2026681 RepID=UPI0010750D4A|nr:hypothetical protein [Flavobacterium foetidum]KAF2506623.1 hypothetical protein E0W73_20985 [Flavobacterium foetidum]